MTEVFPQRWRNAKLSDCCTIRYGLGQPPDEDENGIPMIRATDIKNGTIVSAGVRRVARGSIPLSRKPFLEAGDILVVRSGAYTGDVAMYDGRWSEAVAGYDLVATPDRSLLDPLYVVYYLLSEPTQRYFRSQRARSAQPHLNSEQLGNTSINLPPVSEQRAIAASLRAVQDARDARRRELALERERKAALMEDLFTRGAWGEPLRETGIGPLPLRWTVMPLGDLVYVRGGKRLPKGAEYSAAPTPHPYIRVVDFEDGSVNTSRLKYLYPEIQRGVSRYTIGQHDVYISIAGTVGLVGTIPTTLDGANLTENAAKLVIKDRCVLDWSFLALQLSQGRCQAQIRAFTMKTSQPKLALSRIEQVRVSLPSLEEQRDIAAVLTACDVKIAALEREAAVQDELFRALLEELMTGRLSALPLTKAE